MLIGIFSCHYFSFSMGLFDCLAFLRTYVTGSMCKFMHWNNGLDEVEEDVELLKLNGTIRIRKKSKIFQLRNQIDDFLGRKVKFEIVSSHSLQAVPEGGGLLSKSAWLAVSNAPLVGPAEDECLTYPITFIADKELHDAGALLVTNYSHHEFYLESVTLDDPSNHGQKIHFPCNSWIYNASNYRGARVFFTNQAYLPSQTPEGLAKYRDIELKVLQGDGEGERKWVDRIYDYDVYNDLGAPDHGPEYARTTLGGSKDFPYPRRCRTGRKRNESDKFTEKPVSIPELLYVPRDEIFDRIKTQNFAADSIKAISHLISRTVESISKGKDQFNTMEEVYSLYVNSGDSESHSMRSDDNHLKRKLTSGIFSLLANGKKTGNPSLLKFPLPLIVQKNKDAWSTDAEFARQTIAGMHPFTIQRVKVFPLESKLDPKVYGPPPSSINSHHIEPYLEGMTVSEALKENRLYVLDYHDAFLPYIQKINALKDRKAYASRSMFFLTKEGTLTPVAIELSLPKGTGREDRVFVRPGNTSEKHEQSLWKLAKTHAILNDTAVHQTYSHFVRTHSSIEPIIIASHRQISAMHPLMVLLLPHFKDTLNINALARKVLLNAEVKNIVRGGIIEYTFSSGRYSLELSSILYKDWRFDEQGLPGDLLKRGMAVRDANAKYGLRLLIEDYPYAVDGLEVWDSIETWVTDFIHIFYIRDEDVIQDKELQTWWKEIREKGHGDKKDEPGWPSMDRIEDLVLVVTTIIWLASAHHAAVNFGQYPFAGFMPYRPTVGRKLIPTPNSPEYESFLKDPDAFLLSSISSPAQTIVGLSIIEVLSTHASNEEYLGQRSDTQWTNNPQVMRAFEKFQEKLFKIGQHIEQRNNDPLLKNRYGEVQVPYTLLLPTSKGGITNMGIPNSTSI